MPDATLPELIDEIYEVHPVDIFVMTTKCELSDADYMKYAIGLESVDKVSEAYTSGPMMSFRLMSWCESGIRAGRGFRRLDFAGDVLGGGSGRLG